MHAQVQGVGARSSGRPNRCHRGRIRHGRWSADALHAGGRLLVRRVRSFFVASEFWREPLVRSWRALGEKVVVVLPLPMARTNACDSIGVRAPPHAVQNGARSLRICACATPEASTPAKKFSAGGQAARRSSQTPRRVAGAECLRMCLNGMYEKNSAKEVLFKKPLRKRLCECGVGDRRQRRFASPLADAWRHQTEKYLQKSVDSKKKRD